MHFEVEILDTKKLSESTWFLCKGSLYNYLDNLKPNFFEYIIQRKIVKNKYLNTIVNTILNGEPLPIITLTTSDLVDELEIGKSTAVEMENIEILDGLQRTFRMWAYYKLVLEYKSFSGSPLDFAKKIKLDYPEFFDSAIINLTRIKEYYKDHTFDRVESAFKEFMVYFYVWSGLNPNQVVHKMLVLNAGQRPVSLTHQYELLFLYVWEEVKGTTGVSLYRDRDINASKIKSGERQPGEFMFSSVIAGLRSFIENKPKKVTIDDLDIEDLQQGEAGIQINEGIFTAPFVQIFLEKLKELDTALIDKEGLKGKEWFVKDITLSGVLAGLGKYAKVNELMPILEIQENTVTSFNLLIERISISGFDLNSLELEYYALQTRSINLGTYARTIIMDYTFEMLNGSFPNWQTLFSRSKSKILN